ncbi:MAG: transposase [Bacteroidales bacterium]|nr:transposase [Bacteroidales bacterium]
MERRNYSHIPSEHIIIDEKSFRKGHQYVTVISHSRSGIILDVGQGRDRISTKLLLKKILKKAQLGSIHKVSLDMWSPYMKSVKQKAFNAEIVHDKFHLIKYLNQAIDKVRHREVQKNQVLKKSRYVMLENDQKLIAKQIAKHQMIKDSNFEISKAMNIQENFKSVFDYCHDEGGVIEILTCWAQDSYQKFIKEINKKVVTTFFKHAWDIVNSLISVLNITMSERLYVKIQVIKIAAIGFGKFQNYESAILFFHGWLGLYPENIIRTTTKVI